MAEKEPFQSKAAYIVNTELGISSPTSSKEVNVKTAKDGITILIPQPSDDPRDPLNWSWAKKHTVLITLVGGCFLTDGILSYGSTLFEQQAKTWHMTPAAVSQSISGGVFCQGPGGLLAVAFCQRYGRLPTLFWSQLLLLVVTIGAAAAEDYAGYTACRTLQGFFAAPPQVIGLSMVHDMFFFHERARKINIWAFCFLLGPYFMPFISSWLALALGWRENMWVLVGLVGFSTLIVVLLGDETLYNRVDGEQRETGLAGRLRLLVGITGAKTKKGRPSIWTTQKDQYNLITKPYVLLPTFGFTMPLTMWTIGTVNTVSQFVLPPTQAQPPGYGFTPTAFALLFLAPMIGNLVSEIYNHYQNDFILTFHLKRHPNSFLPEARLWGTYIPWLVCCGGLILYGQTLEHHLHWIGLAVGWGMQTFGTLGTTTASSAYLLDVLPGHASLTAAWILQARVLGGFTVTYFQIPWVMRNGPAVTFGVQAAIIGVAIVTIIATQVWGRTWREKFVPPKPEN